MRIPRLGLVLLGGTTAMEVIGPAHNEVTNCCIPPFAYFDCTGHDQLVNTRGPSTVAGQTSSCQGCEFNDHYGMAGHAVTPGRVYTCENTATLTGCMTCLGTIKDGNDTCTTCCADVSDSECRTLESDWEFYASTVFFVFLCCCFSVLCGLTEVRRKKKGISFAQAWSVPQAMPILRTWPGRSTSAPDTLHAEGQCEGQHWVPLPDEEEDLKQYPVAGLVDDSGVAFGFVSSMPQTLLGSVASTLGRPLPGTMNPPLSPQEPELTVYISRERDQRGSRRSAHPGRVREGTPLTPGREGSDEEGVREGIRAGGRAVVIGSELQEPLFMGDATRSSNVWNSEDVAEAGEHVGQ